MNMNEFNHSLSDNSFFKEAIKHVKAQDVILNKEMSKKQEKHDKEIVKLKQEDEDEIANLRSILSRRPPNRDGF